MAITERDRRDLYNEFERTHGEQFANTIMELLPHQPVDQLVTKADLSAFGDGVRSEFQIEMAGLRSELKNDMGELRSELREDMTELRSELKNDMGELRSELRGEMAELRSELRNDMSNLRNEIVDKLSTSTAETQRLIGASMAANAVAVITALLV